MWMNVNNKPKFVRDVVLFLDNKERKREESQKDVQEKWFCVVCFLLSSMRRLYLRIKFHFRWNFKPRFLAFSREESADENAHFLLIYGHSRFKLMKPSINMIRSQMFCSSKLPSCGEFICCANVRWLPIPWSGWVELFKALVKRECGEGKKTKKKVFKSLTIKSSASFKVMGTTRIRELLQSQSWWCCQFSHMILDDRFTHNEKLLSLTCCNWRTDPNFISSAWAMNRHSLKR